MPVGGSATGYCRCRDTVCLQLQNLFTTLRHLLCDFLLPDLFCLIFYRLQCFLLRLLQPCLESFLSQSFRVLPLLLLRLFLLLFRLCCSHTYELQLKSLYSEFTLLHLQLQLQFLDV